MSEIFGERFHVDNEAFNSFENDRVTSVPLPFHDSDKMVEK